MIGNFEIRIDTHFSGNLYFQCFPCDLDTGSGRNPPENGIFSSIVFHKGEVEIEWDNFLKYSNGIKKAAEKSRSVRFENRL